MEQDDILTAPEVAKAGQLDLEKVLRELRLMKGQPNHRYYTHVLLVILFVLRHPIASTSIAAVLWYFHLG